MIALRVHLCSSVAINCDPGSFVFVRGYKDSVSR